MALDVELAFTDAGQHVSRLLDCCESLPPAAREVANNAALFAAYCVLQGHHAIGDDQPDMAWLFAFDALNWLNDNGLRQATASHSEAEHHRQVAAELVRAVARRHAGS